MDANHSFINLTLGINVTQHIPVPGDLSLLTLARIRQDLIRTRFPHNSQSAVDYEFIVEGKKVGFMEAAKRKGSRIMNISLKLIEKTTEGKEREKRKRDEITKIEQRIEEQIEKVYKPIEGIPYTVTKHLLRIMAENRINFQSERDGNGVFHQFMFEVMGFLSVNTHRIQLSRDLQINTLRFQKEPMENLQLIHIVKNNDEYPLSTFVICPFLLPRHVSLCCFDKRHDRLLHFDASSSIHPENKALFKSVHLFNNVSYTYINYQMYDDTNPILQLAGGNCGMFSGTNAIKCLESFQAQPIGFYQCWERFLQVLEKTTESKRALIAMDFTRSVCYVAEGQDTKDEARNVKKHGAISPNQIHFFPQILAAMYPEWVEKTDFTCDYIMLGYFLEANIGFDQVNLLGNALRILIRDVRERNFVSLNITEAMKRLCVGCKFEEAQFVCPCSSDVMYCSQECQSDHWIASHADQHNEFALVGEEIVDYINNLKRNHGAALQRLIEANFFGPKYRVANGDLMWHLIHQSNWPEQQGRGYSREMENVLNKMKEHAEKKEFSEDNLQYVVELAKMGAFGDVSRVIHPEQKFMPKDLQRPSNWLRNGIKGSRGTIYI